MNNIPDEQPASQPDCVVVPEFTIDQFNKAAEIVGTMEGYEGESPDSDHFVWLNAMLRAAKETK
jgi:hypothetical protein